VNTNGVFLNYHNSMDIILEIHYLGFGKGHHKSNLSLIKSNLCVVLIFQTMELGGVSGNLFGMLEDPLW
jgi:hypothetical protein